MARRQRVVVHHLRRYHPEPLLGDLLAPQDLAADTTGDEIYWADGNAG